MSTTYSFTQRTIDGFSASHESFNNVDIFLLKMSAIDLLKLNSVPVYEISIKVDEFTVKPLPQMVKKSNTEYTFYVADKIQTDTEINRAMFEKYGKPRIYSIPSPTGQPAILTGVTDEIPLSDGLVMDEKRHSATPSVFVGKHINWHILDPKTDIVLDGQLRQIYPKKTGYFPVFLQELLQKTK